MFHANVAQRQKARSVMQRAHSSAKPCLSTAQAKPWLGSIIAMAFALAMPAAFAQEARPPVNAVPVGTMDQLGKALFACWAPPPGTEGSEITFKFGLTAKGELRGKPLATYSVLKGSEERQRAFVEAALLALSRCTPVRMTEQFARVAASRVLILRFASGERRT
jgi:hypothetical protein